MSGLPIPGWLERAMIARASQVEPITERRANAGIAELALFHPVDTIAKRLMSNKNSAVRCLSVAMVVREKLSAG